MPYTKTRLSDFSDIKSARVPLFTEIIPAPSSRVGMVSGVVPLVSSHPPISFARYMGMLPSRDWGRTGLPKGSRRVVITEMGLFKFVTKVITAPLQPMVMFKGLAERIQRQSEEESEALISLEDQLLEFKMRFELEEIGEEEYKKKEKELVEKINAEKMRLEKKEMKIVERKIIMKKKEE